MWCALRVICGVQRVWCKWCALEKMNGVLQMACGILLAVCDVLLTVCYV